MIPQQINRPQDVMVDKQVAHLAYLLWEKRGRPIGTPEVDWYRAVEQIDREQCGHLSLPCDH